MESLKVKNKKSSQDEQKCDFANLKSKYILKYMFDHFERHKLLEIVRYNNEIKKRLELSINDYKEYSTIEIELIPAKNKYRKFINILENSNEINYRIYFNDSNERIQRYSLTKNDNVKKVRIIIGRPVVSFMNYLLIVNALNL